MRVYNNVYIIRLCVIILSQINHVHVCHSTSCIPVLLYLPIYACVFQVVCLSQVSSPKPFMHLSRHSFVSQTPPSHISFLYHPNYILLAVQIINLTVIKSFSLPSHLVPLPSYPTQPPNL